MYSLAQTLFPKFQLECVVFQRPAHCSCGGTERAKNFKIASSTNQSWYMENIGANATDERTCAYAKLWNYNEQTWLWKKNMKRHKVSFVIKKEPLTSILGCVKLTNYAGPPAISVILAITFQLVPRSVNCFKWYADTITVFFRASRERLATQILFPDAENSDQMLQNETVGATQR